MAIIFQVRATSPTSSEAFNVLAYRGGVYDTSYSTALAGLYTDLQGLLLSTASYSLEPEARFIDDSTGQTMNILPIPPADQFVVTGTGGSGALADASALLLRWRTATFIDGRRVQGRSYIPYIAFATGGGQPSAASVTEAQTAIDNFLAANTLTPFAIWHRPNPETGTGGDTVDVVSGSAWSEYGVQRRRRN